MATGEDVEQFAALLRRLKDRTDRSYGSLARRLNMNTSTLHRYCAGEATPQDYAPVERLAAFCGATQEERLELHRLWLLAVTARQRPRAGEGTAAQPSTGGPEPTGLTEAEEAAGDGTSEGRSRSAADASGTGPAVPDVSGSGAVARVRTGSPEPTALPGMASSTGQPWYRRRRSVVGAAAASVLLIALSSLSALSADRHHADSAKDPGRSRTTGATGTPRAPSGTATASAPALGPSPASPSPGVRASRSPGVKAKASTDAKGGTPAPTGPPLAWTVDSQVWDGGCGHDYVIDKKPAQVPPPPVPQDAAVWAATQGAVPGRQTTVQISVQGKSSTAVVLEALRVRVVGRGTPVTGNAYAMGQGCGSDLPPRAFSVNLDVDRPIAHPLPGNDGGEPTPAVRFPYRVSAEDPEVLMVTATTTAYDCTWYLELDWSSQGRSGTVRVDDHGGPFRTSGTKGLAGYWYGTNSEGARQWVPTDPE